MARRHLLAPLMLALLVGSAAAQDVRLYRADEAVDPHDVAHILDTSRPGAPAMKMRSLRLLDDATGREPGGSSAPQQVSAATPAATQPAGEAYASAAGRTAAAPNTTGAPPSHPVDRVQAKALALPIQFAFDSADILPAARRQLEALAEGIRMLPVLQSVVIEGHTDARGSEAYNDQLSTRRAYAIKRYLVTVQGIDPGRLRAVGMGKYAPLPGRDPYAPENRRVQFRGE